MHNFIKCKFHLKICYLDFVISLTFSSNGKYIATVSCDYTLCLIDLKRK